MELSQLGGMAAGMGYGALWEGFVGLRSKAACYSGASWKWRRLGRTASLCSASRSMARSPITPSLSEGVTAGMGCSAFCGRTR